MTFKTAGLAEAAGQLRPRGKDAGVRQGGLPGDELGEKTQKQFPLVPGSGNCLPLDLLAHTQWAMLTQGQGPVIGTGHLRVAIQMKLSR